MKKSLPLLIICLVYLFSCRSEHKRLDFELTVTERGTGLPVKAAVCVSYRPYPGQDTRFEKFLGTTGEDGVLKYNQERDDKMFDAELVVYADEDKYGFPMM